jgi:hypothetical protein
MSQVKRKKASTKNSRSTNKVGAAQKLRKWLDSNKQGNVLKLRKWMKSRAIPGRITNLINDATRAEHCHCALNELVVSAPKKPRRK